MQDLAGKTALITGAASGIGLALAQRLAAEPMRIVLGDVSEDELADATKQLEAAGADVLPMLCDVTDPASLDALADAAYARYGSVDVLCANAGIMGPPVGLIWEVPLEDWKRVFEVNVFGFVNTFRAFIPRMIAAGTPGHVLVTASVRSLMVGPLGSQYQTSKHAGLAMADVLRKQLAFSGAPIGVSALCPGPVMTGFLRREMAHAQSTGNRLVMPNEVSRPSGEVDFGPMSAEDVADCAVRGIQADRPYVFSHPESKDGVHSWLDPILAALEG